MIKDQKGFTLLELLIAVAILALVMSPFFSQFVKSTEIGERSERIVRAEYIAQKAIEEEKRLVSLPDSGNTRSFVEDNFTVVLTYSDKTSDVNTSNEQLKLFIDDTSPDLVIKPTISLSKVSLDFYKNAALISSINDMPYGDKLSLYLDSNASVSSYSLNFDIEGGESGSITNLTKLDTEDVILRFEGVESGVNGTLLNVILVNRTDGTDERKMKLFEVDDLENNFNFITGIGSSGDVETTLKLISNPSTQIDNNLDYYWVQVQVIDSSGEVMAELYSSVRKE